MKGDRFNFTDEIKFSKAVYYHFKPIPLFREFKDATGGLGRFAPETGYLELQDSEGFCAHLTVSAGFLSDILPRLLTGEKKSYTTWRDELYWQIRNCGFQSGQAVEVGQADLMMLDLLAQRKGQALHRFLGAKKDWAAAYKGGGSLLLEDSELVEDMARYVEEGYTAVKFKVGSGMGMELERDLLRLEKVRGAVGESVEIAVDANQSWDADRAAKFARLAKTFRLAWLEEPVHSQDMNEISRLKDLIPEVPLAFGESMRCYYPYETYAEKGVSHLQPSIGRMSRMDDLLKIRDLAHKRGLRFSSGGRVSLNAVWGCLYDEDELIEYHEPISKPVGEYTLNAPIEKNGVFYTDSTISGNPIRINLKKLEIDGLLESSKIYYADK